MCRKIQYDGLKGFWFFFVELNKALVPKALVHRLRLPRSAAQARSLSADLLLLPPLALRLDPRGRIFRASAAPPRRRPSTEGQSQARRRRRSPSRLSPVASRPRLRPPPPAGDPAYAPPSPLPPLLYRGSPASCLGWPGLGSAGGFN